jgi:DNA-binding protein HU-beta
MDTLNLTVSTTQLIDMVAEKHGDLTKKKTKEVISDFLAAIETEVALNGAKVRVERLGVFEVRETAERTGRHPRTGESIRIPASRKIAFRMSKSLKEAAMGKSEKAAT